MPFARHKLRDNEVYARVDANGDLVKDSTGRVDVVYKPVNGAKLYRAGASNLVPLGGATVDIEPAAADDDKPKKSAGGAAPSMAAGTIHVWTDGACTGNPGPAGLGVVYIDGKERQELSEYLGEGTNNIAELTAIERGLQLVQDRSRPVAVYTDSSYSIGVVSKNWKAKANVELVARIRALAAQFKQLTFVKVAGHSGIVENERTDELATGAVRRGR